MGLSKDFCKDVIRDTKEVVLDWDFYAEIAEIKEERAFDLHNKIELLWENEGINNNKDFFGIE